MLKRLFPITLLTFMATVAFAQNPQPAGIAISNSSNQPEGILACAPGTGNEAGTISLGAFNGSSNDVDFDTMYLCFNDQIFIDHDAGTEDFSGDPITSSPSGIGYAVYDCPPSVIFNGELATIQNDPCITSNPPPTGGAVLPYIATPPNTTGDILFDNDGGIQTFFNGGAPVLKWFAPITYDSLSIIGGIGFANYEGLPSGPCVDVNEQEAFAVVYLNEITATNQQTSGTLGGNPEISNCIGTFELDGGLPEFDNNESYNISITLASDPTVTGTLVSVSGGLARFKIFEPGLYDISITDGKACPANFQMDMTGCTALGTNIPDVTALPASTVCVPFFAQDFTDIFSFQYSIHWDPTILSFANVNYVNTDLNSADLNFNPVGIDALTSSFFYLSGGAASLTVPDGDPLFEVCFNVLGPVGSTSPINIDGDPTIIDVYNGNNAYLGFVSNAGSVTIVNQAIFDITITPNDVSCNGLSDGSIDFTVNVPSNGTAPFNIGYSEVGNPTNNGSITGVNDGDMVTQPGLPAGTYALTIADSSTPPVVDLDTIVINEPPILGASISVSQPILCFGDTNGSFTADVIVGGVIVNNPGPEYTFLWTPGNVTTQTIPNVNPALGTYAVTITDGNMCTAVASTTPSQPSELTVGVMVTDAACSGIDNGEIEATGMGGVSPTGTYSYAWSTTPTQTTQTATNLGIGTYTVTITDDNMCAATATGTVSAATIIFANSVVQDVNCNGANDGAIFHSPSVIGTNNGGYTYQWSPNVSTMSSASPLAPGTYTTTITDALGCNIDTTIIISEPDALAIDGMVNTTDETCAIGGNDGTASVNVIGGTPFPNGSYTYSWTCCVGVDANSVNSVPSGNYIVTIEDANNCSISAPFTINPPMPPMIVSFDSISVECPTDTNGELTVNATNGNAPITNYTWTFPNGTNANGQTISNLGPGTYTVTVTSADGCEAIDSAFLYAPEQLMLVQPLPTNPNCFGESSGTATVQMSGGTMPYAYQWSTNAGNSTNSAVPALPSGTYTVTVTDANMCDQVVTEVILEDPDSITIVFTDITPVSCFGQVVDCDGGATALASGGNAPSAIYTFSWSSGEIEVDMSSTASQLCQGIQTVVVTDENNCFNVASVDIPAPPPLGINPILNEPSCFGGSDGSITANGTGGVPAYTFEWGNGTTDITLANIPAGDYPVTVTDMNGCEFETVVTLGEPEILVAFIDSTENVTCGGDADGFIEVGFTGGNGAPMTYTWSGGVSTTNSASGLSPGIYTITVEDVNGCSAEVSQVISEPIPVFGFIPTPEEPICNGDQTLLTVETAGGGTGAPYTFSVDGGPAQNIGTAISVFAGDHVVEISDGNGCTYTEDIFINEPPAIIVNLGPDVEIQLGESLQLNAILSGSNVPIDSIIWTPAIFDSISCMSCLNPIVSPLDDQTYTIEIFDINGCNGSDDIFIEVDKNRNVFIPNVFTPNGDGFNDEFQVFSGPGVTQINSMQIFDRWGELVFERNNLAPSAFPDVANGWDGQFRGRVMNPGVFVYLIEVTFDDGITLLYRGDVTLLH